MLKACNAAERLRQCQGGCDCTLCLSTSQPV